VFYSELDLFRSSYGSFFVFMFFLLVVSFSAVDYLERLVSEITCYVFSGAINYSLTHCLPNIAVYDLTVFHASLV